MKCLGLPVVVNLAGRMAKLGFNPAPDKRAEHNTTIPSVPAHPSPRDWKYPVLPPVLFQSFQSRPNTYLVSHICAPSCLNECPGQVLRATKGCVVEAAQPFLERNGHQGNFPRHSHVGVAGCLEIHIPLKSHGGRNL